MRMLLASAVFLMISNWAHADITDKLFKSKVIDCFIIGALDEDENSGFDFNFSVSVNDANRGSHGGEEKTFEYKNNKVVAVANDRWLGLAWWVGDKKIGETVTLSTSLDSKSRVLVLINPENEYERVSITCDLK